MIINATSHTMKNIWRFFLVILFLITFLFLILTNGIRIDHLILPKVKISQLYIKLDKKLIVSIEKIDINIKSKNNSSLKEIHDITKNLPYLHMFFESISIHNITYDNKTVQLLYKNDVFYGDSNFLTIDAKIKNIDGSIDIDIKRMILKDFNLSLKGALNVNLINNEFNFKGKYQTFNINGNTELKIINNVLYYRLNSKKFKSLKPLMDFLSKKINLEPLISAWIYKKIIAQEYELHNIEGKFNLNTFDFYPKLMKAKATGKNVLIKFDKNVPPVLVNEMDIILKNDQLIFDIKKAEYQGKDVTKTKVHIYHLMTVGAGIVVDIKANTILDDSIHDILHAFDIRVPITQTAGTTEANVKIDIKFRPFGVKSYTGYFKINDANITLSGLPIYSKSGYITLDNGIVTLENVNLKYNTIFDIYTSGDLNINNGVYNSENFIDTLNINFDNLNILHIENFNTKSSMKIMDNGTSIYIDKLKTTLEFLNNTNKIKLEDLSLIYPYSKIMHTFDVRGGKVDIDTKNFIQYNVNAKLEEMNIPLTKNNKPITELELLIKTDGSDLTLSSVDKNIELIKKDNINLKIKNIDVVFDSSKLDNSIELGDITITGINSNITDTNSTLNIPSDHFVYKINKQHKTFNSTFFKQTIFLEQTDKTLYINSKNLSAKYVNSLLGRESFNGGSFEFYVDGVDFEHLDGTFIANNTIIEGTSFYNNLMAFLQTIPSLVSFKTPGFNKNGYLIKDAVIDFSRDGDILTVDEINIKGKSTDIIGSGTINLKTDEINILLQISTLKNLTSLVSYIPLVNYIILGEDGRIYTDIDVKGTISNPKMTTHIIKDTAMSPLRIIKRTFETPFRMFQKMEN